MILFHGTKRRFDTFSLNFVGTTEGVAKRGWGMNLTADPDVAQHYFERTGADRGFILEVRAPDKQHLIDLDASAYNMPQTPEDIVAAFGHKVLGLHVWEYFEAIADHESVPLGESYSLAEDAFDRLLVDVSDAEAWETLKRFAPEFNFAPVERSLKEISPQLPEEFTGGDFYQAMAALANEKGMDEAAWCEFLDSLEIRGTYSHETIGSHLRGCDTTSFVVFNPEYLSIIKRHQLQPGEPEARPTDLEP